MVYHKICILCGKEFTTTYSKRSYCYDTHYKKCEVCGKEFVVRKTSIGQKCCSRTCADILGKINREKTCMKKYGVSNAGWTADSQRKIKDYNQEHYGSDWFFQTNEFKSSAQQTNLERYGVKNPQQNKDIKAKTEATCIQRYGDTIFGKNSTIRQQVQARGQALYGKGGYGNSPQANEKRRRTNIKRFGVPYCMQNQDVQEKSKRTNLERYGVEYIGQSEEAKAKIRATNLERWGNESAMKSEEVKRTMKTHMLEKYGVPWPCMLPQCVKGSSRLSIPHQNFCTILEQRGIEYEIEFPLEDRQYDVKIDSILIEIDPTISHSTQPNWWFREATPQYHLDKTLLANSHDYQCIHVFDWDDYGQVVDMVQYELTHGVIQAALKYCNQENGLLKVDRSKFQLSTFSKIEEIIPPQENWSKDNEVKPAPDDDADIKSLKEKGWRPVYDCGYEMINMKFVYNK